MPTKKSNLEKYPDIPVSETASSDVLKKKVLYPSGEETWPTCSDISPPKPSISPSKIPILIYSAHLTLKKNPLNSSSET